MACESLSSKASNDEMGAPSRACRISFSLPFSLSRPRDTMRRRYFCAQVDLLFSGNRTLTFKYEVQEGDSTSDLDYASSTALNLNGGLSGCVAK